MRSSLLLLATAGCAVLAEKPNIFLVLVDDLGWGNVGFHRDDAPRDVITPTIDSLAAEGVELNRHYVHFFCTPTRASLLSGRLPVHVNTGLQNPEASSAGPPRNMTSMAEVLVRGGYEAHMVGKWDAGMASRRHLPVGRGFNSSLNLFSHKNDFFTKRSLQTKCPGQKPLDFWDTDRPAEVGRRYQEHMFRDRMVDIINKHPETRPLFLYYAPLIAHNPLQIPQWYFRKFAALTRGTDQGRCRSQTKQVNPRKPKHQCRAQYNAMMNVLDDILKDVIAAFKQKGMWDNTLMVFSADNGGPVKLVESAANNYPLKGGKYSVWEGGIRGTAFVSGGYLPASARGTKLEQLMHVADWYATFAALAGQDPTDTLAAESGLPPIDSLNMWPVITGQQTVSPRKEVPVSSSTLISGDWKLIVSDRVGWAGWGGPVFPNRTARGFPKQNCAAGCLYNVATDPSEYQNVAASRPGQVNRMKQRLEEHKATFWRNSEKGVPACPKDVEGPCACWMAKNYYGGYFGPFEDFTIEA